MARWTTSARDESSFYRDPKKLFNPWEHRSYLLDQPIAVTHGDRLYLFFRPATGGVLLFAETSAFEPTGVSLKEKVAKIAKEKPAAAAAMPVPIAAGGVLPVPSAEDRRKRVTEIEQLFEVDKATTKKEKLALSKRLLKTGVETRDDPVASFVLINLAREKAEEAGNILAAWQAIDAMAGIFQFDVFAVRGISVRQTANAPSLTSTERKAIVERGEAWIGEQLASDHYSNAIEVMGLMERIGSAFNDTRLVEQMSQRKESTRAIASEHAQYLAATKGLTTSPGEKELRVTAGRFLAFRKQRWRQGFELLANGSDKALAEIAALELKNTDDPKQRFDLAQHWLALAEESSDPNTTRVAFGRAAALLKLANPGLSGLSKVKATRDLATIAVKEVQPLVIDLGAEPVEPPTKSTPTKQTPPARMTHPTWMPLCHECRC